jgi:hypothetical protein
MNKEILNMIQILSILILFTFFKPTYSKEITLTSEWTIVTGNDHLEEQAANDLKKILTEKYSITLQGPIRDTLYKGKGNAIFIGTVNDHFHIREENIKAPFTLDIKEPESYHFIFKNMDNNSSLWIVGASAKGAMNGVFRFLDKNTLNLERLNEALSPVFTNRVGGHKMNQHPPADWTEEQQAAYYAQHYINIIWGEKKAPPLSYEARQKYGLGVMLEAKFPPKGDQWKDNPENASAVYLLDTKSKSRVIDPFDPKGREAYLGEFQKALKKTPDAKIFYGIFGDYSRVPGEKSIRVSDQQPLGHTREEVIKEIMAIMKEAIGDQEIVSMVWLWHALFGQDEREKKLMKELTSMGYGVIYNEAGNNDDWIFKRDNFVKSALETDSDGKTIYGDLYMPLISAGGACESINPVIGLPLPAVAACKIKKLTDIKVKNFVLWWASVEGWTYQANMEVIKEMIWNPNELSPENSASSASGNINEAVAYNTKEIAERSLLDPVNPSPLLKKIAVRDFGHIIAPDILKYWELLDKAIVTDVQIYLAPDSPERPGPAVSGLQIYSWWQRLGMYTEAIFGGAYPHPLTAKVLSNKEYFKNINFGTYSYTIANYKEVIGNLNLVNKEGERILSKKIPDEVRKKVQDMHNWVQLLTCLLTSQYNHFSGLNIMKKFSEMPPDAPSVKHALLPVINDELRNIENYNKVIAGFPENFNIRLNMEGVVTNKGDRDGEIAFLNKKAKAMIEYLNEDPIHYSNIIANNPVTISLNGNIQRVSNLTDGNVSTFLEGKLKENEILISFAKPVDIESLVLKWGNAVPSEYKIYASDDEKKWENISKQIPLNVHVSIDIFPLQKIQYLKILVTGNMSLRELQLYSDPDN